MTDLGSKLSGKNGGSIKGDQEDVPRVLDSVLGDTNRDVLLKAVIQKCDFATKKMELVDSRLSETVKANYDEY